MSENRQINDEAQKAYDEAKKYFSKFEQVDWMGPNQVNIAPDALPSISDEEQAKRIDKAMKRLYGGEEVPKDEVIREEIPKEEPTDEGKSWENFKEGS